MLLHYHPFEAVNLPELYGNILFFYFLPHSWGPIVWTALKNVTHGEFFDETFLMTVATLGAFGIQEYPEAVGVMFFTASVNTCRTWPAARAVNRLWRPWTFVPKWFSACRR